MKPNVVLTHEFVEFIPEELKDKILYVSIPYATAIHKCCCGCGNKVVTPLSPTDWKLIFDGETISLYPSIGNWSLECRSHYWIRDNQVKWAEEWSQKKVDTVRTYDRSNKKNYFKSNKSKNFKKDGHFWSALKDWWS